MQNFTWEIDANTIVKLKFSLLGLESVFINEQEVLKKRSFKFKNLLNFTLPDGRNAQIKVSTSNGFIPDAELTVEGEVFHMETPGVERKCEKCDATAKMNDKFCQSCGSELADPAKTLGEKNVKEAKNAILVLAIIFSLFGVGMFFIQKGQYDNFLKGLNQYQASEVYPEQIGGQSVTVGELTKRVQFEKFSVLAINLFLAVIMLGLSFWANSSPLGAILVATAIYFCIQVMNAIYDPATIVQGFIMKIIIISFLIKGIKSALKLRALNVS